MLILLPVFVLILTAAVLLVLHTLIPKFKYPWILAAGGAILALISVFLWQIQMPGSISLPSWSPVPSFPYVLAWLADGISWPYVLSLTALATAVILTSVIRVENDSMPWAGILIISALGILAIAAENPFTLLLAWSAIDLFELVIVLRSSKDASHYETVIITFAVRLLGSFFIIWSNLVNAARGIPLDFRAIPDNTAIYLLIGVCLRSGVLPLRLQYRKGNVNKAGFGTTIRLVTTASSLALLSRLPASSSNSVLAPYLLILIAFTALYAGWMWLRSSDEIQGRPYWMLGFAALAVAESLIGNPTGSLAWGVVFVLSGGALFLFSARQRSILWIIFPGLWVLSSLPFSLTASAWQIGNSISWLFIIPFLPAHALLIAGFFRHALHHGETRFESQEKWIKVIYPTGILILMLTALLLGFWGWPGAQTISLWWTTSIIILLAIGFILAGSRVLVRMRPNWLSNRFSRLFQDRWIYTSLAWLYNLIRKIVEVLTFSLEGEGGLLWTFLLLVLVLSILFIPGR